MANEQLKAALLAVKEAQIAIERCMSEYGEQTEEPLPQEPDAALGGAPADAAPKGKNLGAMMAIMGKRK